MKPWQFWNITPRDFNDLVDGWAWRRNRQQDSFAVWTCALINATGKLKHPVQPARLLGRPVGVDPSPAKDAAVRAHRIRQAEEKRKADEARKRAEEAKPIIILATR